MFNLYCGTFRGEKCPGCDFYQALVSTSKVKNHWKCISASHRDKCRGGGRGCCYIEDNPEWPHCVVLITDRSHFTEFLFALFCFNIQIYTTFELTQ